MRKLGLLGLFVVWGVACGGAPSREPQAHRSNVVAVPSAAETEDEPPAVADGGRPSDHASNDLGHCALELRTGASVPSRGEDRSGFARAFAAEQSGNPSEARKGYFELIQKEPASPLIPLAYLAFGEMFAREAEADPSKWGLAQAAYQEVLKYPPPDNIAYVYTQLRLGDTRSASDPTQAMASYVHAVEGARTYPALPCAELIGAQARSRLIEAYSRAGAPDKAWAFFRAKSDGAQATEMLLELIALYRQKHDPSAACAAAKSGAAEPRLEREKASVCGSH